MSVAPLGRLEPLARLALVALLATPATARAAPTKNECSDAADRAQALRRAGHIAAARAELRTCLSASCPGLIVHDCSQWLDQADQSQPSIVFATKDATGADVSDVRVTIDGKALASRLDGEALDVDPGEHAFAFIANGVTVTRKLIIREGEKRRRENVVVGAAGPPAPGTVTPVLQHPDAPARADTIDRAATVDPGQQPTHRRVWGAQRIAGVATAGAGVMGLVAGSVFGGLTFGAVSDQRVDCGSASACRSPKAGQTDHTNATTDSTISTVAFVAGGALVAAGVALYFTAPTQASSSTTLATITPTLGTRGPGLSLTGTF